MNKTLEKVLSYIREAIAQHPIREKGKAYSPSVRYMNGNDGTGFDWGCNDRTCEFFVFYDTGDNALGYVKAYVTRDGNIEGYVWDTERYEDGVRLPSVPLATEEESKEYYGHYWWRDGYVPLAKARARRFRDWLMKTRDKENVYDKEIATL